WTPVLPEATAQAPPALLRRSPFTPLPTALAPLPAFLIGPMNGRRAQESGRRRYGHVAPGASGPESGRRPAFTDAASFRSHRSELRAPCPARRRRFRRAEPDTRQRGVR